MRKMLAISTLFLSSAVFAGWNIVDHPFETVTIENGDDLYSLGDTISFWTRIRIDDDKKHYLLAEIWGECKTLNYIKRFRETNITKDNSLVTLRKPSDIKVANPEDMMYYALMYHCDNQPTGWGMCYPEGSEDLDRTPQAEMLDILTKEMEM